MESMWHEILNEQKETNKLNKQLFSKMEYLSGKTETIEKEPNNRQKIPSPADTKVFHEIITEGHRQHKTSNCSATKKRYPSKANNDFS